MQEIPITYKGKTWDAANDEIVSWEHQAIQLDGLNAILLARAEEAETHAASYLAQLSDMSLDHAHALEALRKIANPDSDNLVTIQMLRQEARAALGEKA